LTGCLFFGEKKILDGTPTGCHLEFFFLEGTPLGVCVVYFSVAHGTPLGGYSQRCTTELKVSD
jgi:hypothetical protein